MLRTGARQRVVSLVWLALALSLLPPLVMSQGPVQPSLRLEADSQRLALGPNDTATLRVTVTNLGQTDGTLTFDATGPAGWIITEQATSATLTAGRSTTIDVGVRPGDTTPTNGTIALTGRLTNAANQVDQKTSNVAVNYVAPAVPPPPPPPPSPWPMVLGIAGGVVLLLLGLYVAQSFLVTMTVQESRVVVTKGTHSHYDITVRNRAPFAQTVELRLRGLDRPWAAAFNVPHARLAAGESVVCPVSVKPPFEAPDDHEVQFVAQVRPNRFALWLVKRPLTAHVARKERIVPEEPVSASVPG